VVTISPTSGLSYYYFTIYEVTSYGTSPVYSTPVTLYSAVITSGLRYQFDAAKNLPTTSGWTDANGYGNLTFYNSPTITSGSINYVTFDGTSQYGTSLDMTNLTAFTVTMWVRTTSTANNGNYYSKPTILGEDSPNQGTKDLGITIGGGYAGVWTGLQTSTDNTNIAEGGTGTANYIAGNGWKELTVTSSSTNGTKLYINATQFGSALTVNQATEVGQNWFIGAKNSGIYPVAAFAAFDISILFLYTRELSSTEVTSNFTSFRARFGV
jgi:hypothetical protein